MIRGAGRTTALAGVGVILAVNLGLLGSAAWDRSGEPQARLSLTERELELPVDRQEQSAGIEFTLRLATEAPGRLRRAARSRRASLPRVDLPWFDRAKLEELGVRIDVEPDDPDAVHHYRDAQLQRAFVVLEYDGDAWSRWLEERTESLERMRREVEAGSAEESDLGEGETWLAFDRMARSRLFPVDVGLDASALLKRYGDRDGILVLPCLIGPWLHEPDDGPPMIRGRVRDVPARWISVASRFKTVIEPLMPTEKRLARQMREGKEAREAWPEPAPPRYAVEVAAGRRHALRLVQVELIEPVGAEN